MEEIIKRIESFRDLGYNWNGYEAKPLSETAILAAIDFVKLIGYSSNMEVFPTQCDTIQIEWENDEYYVETQIYPDVSVESFSQWKGKFKHENHM